MFGGGKDNRSTWRRGPLAVHHAGHETMNIYCINSHCGLLEVTGGHWDLCGEYTGVFI